MSREEWRGFGVFIEQDEGVVEETSLEILGRIRELADKYNIKITSFVLTDDINRIIDKIRYYGSDEIVYAENSLFKTYLSDVFSTALYRLVSKYRPRYLLLPATRNSRDLAGRLAIMLRTCLLAHVISIDIDPETMRMNAAVPGFGGNIAAVCECVTTPEMATVSPGVFTPKIRKDIEPKLINESDLTKDLKTLMRKISRTSVARPDISRSEKIVVAGAGCIKDLELIKKFAKIIGAEYAVTRPVADAGLAPRDLQVGSTGISLKSKLVIVLGASGAPHFVSGIRDCGTVVSINIDPDAPIKDFSDLFVVGDLYDIVKKLIDRLGG